LTLPVGIHNLKSGGIAAFEFGSALGTTRSTLASPRIQISSVKVLVHFYRSSVGKKNDRRGHRDHSDPFRDRTFARESAIFIGPDWINGYSEHLRDLGPLLWLIRIFLLATVITHIYVTIQLAIENRRARPEAYIDKSYVKATFASRHMVMSGLIVLAFIVYHLAHFTVRVTDPRFGLLKADPSATTTFTP
jgi:hypothetical protein